jgi:hypothetical protein
LELLPASLRQEPFIVFNSKKMRGSTMSIHAHHQLHKDHPENDDPTFPLRLPVHIIAGTMRPDRTHFRLVLVRVRSKFVILVMPAKAQFFDSENLLRISAYGRIVRTIPALQLKYSKGVTVEWVYRCGITLPYSEAEYHQEMPTFTKLALSYRNYLKEVVRRTYGLECTQRKRLK